MPINIADKVNKFFPENALANTHFEIGTKIHSDTYYNIKEYFTDTANCRDLAHKMAEKIRDIFGACNDTTFVGTGLNSGYFFNEMIFQLNYLLTGEADESKFDQNYAIINDFQENLSFYFHPPTLRSRFIIILHNTCTFAHAFTIEKLLNNYIGENTALKHHTVSKKIITAFLIVDNTLYEELNNNNETAKKINLGKTYSSQADKKKLYSFLRWESVENETISFVEEDGAEKHKGYFLVTLKADLSLSEECRRCFPENLNEEISIFPTRVSNDTPAMIFGLPNFSNYLDEKGKFSKIDFSSINFLSSDDKQSAHLFGHLKHDENSFLHYIIRGIFYENNKHQILHHFEKEVGKVLEEWEQSENLLIITPKHKRSSKFLPDFLKSRIFTGKNVNLLMVEPSNEFIENFKKQFDDKGYKDYKIIFFDFVISGALTYRRLNDYLRSYRSGPFDLVLCIVDQTTSEAKDELVRNIIDGENCYIAFLKLNMPLITAFKSGNPIHEKLFVLNYLVNECHLDALKMYIGKEIINSYPKNFEELEYENEILDLSDKKRNLLKLHLAHCISNWFARQKDASEKTKQKIPDSFNLLILLKDILEEFRNYTGRYLKGENLLNSEVLITRLIIKTLSRPPFKFYYGVYEPVFGYVRDRLAELIGDGKNGIPDDKIDALKFLLKRSVELNSSLMVSQQFISALKNTYIENSEHKLKDRKYFILKCYKSLIFKNPARAIKLEELINNKELLPEPLLNMNMPLKEALQDHFYQQGRIIKSENIYLLNELKMLFLKDMRIENEALAFLRNQYSRYKDEAIQRDTINKIRHSLNTLSVIYSKLLKAIKKMPSVFPDGIQYMDEVWKVVDSNPDKERWGGSGLENHIKDNYLIVRENSRPVIKLANTFLQRSKVYCGLNGEPIRKEDENELLRPVGAMLASIFLLETKEWKEQNFINNISTILTRVGRIFHPQYPYAFFMEYTEPNPAGSSKENGNIAGNIFTIVSNTNDKDDPHPKILKSGFIYAMLNGLKDFSNKEKEIETEHKLKASPAYRSPFTDNVQTFIVIARDETGNNISFKDEYASIIKTEETTLRVTPALIEKDCKQRETGLQIFSDAQVILLFRLAEFEFDAENRKNISNGQAVFAICYPKELFQKDTSRTSTKKLTDFINVEKVRLLLLIKEELLGYLREQFKNASFVDWLDQIKRSRIKENMEHGVKDYVYSLRTLSLIYNPTDSDNRKMTWLNQCIFRHFESIVEDETITYGREGFMWYKSSELEQRFDDMMTCPMPFIDIPRDERELVINDSDFICHPIIFEMIIPEILLNMRKYSYPANPVDKNYFKIDIQKSKIIFSNYFNTLNAGPEKHKSMGGIQMCKSRLHKFNLKMESGMDEMNRFCMTLFLN